jgi:hypothetical protein
VVGTGVKKTWLRVNASRVAGTTATVGEQHRLERQLDALLQEVRENKLDAKNPVESRANEDRTTRLGKSGM